MASRRLRALLSQSLPRCSDLTVLITMNGTGQYLTNMDYLTNYDPRFLGMIE